MTDLWGRRELGRVGQMLMLDSPLGFLESLPEEGRAEETERTGNEKKKKRLEKEKERTERRREEEKKGRGGVAANVVCVWKKWSLQFT